MSRTIYIMGFSFFNYVILSFFKQGFVDIWKNLNNLFPIFLIYFERT